MQIEYATAFISCKQLLLYDEPLRDANHSKSTVYVLEKKTYRKYGFIFWWNFFETLGQDHDSILALLLQWEKGFFFQFYSSDFAFVL